ncbi:hypothetical protein MMC19_001267 [Ptychographa xylographoides]|nr:hypothetical protein [Ptychographa xylographoides]
MHLLLPPRPLLTLSFLLPRAPSTTTTPLTSTSTSSSTLQSLTTRRHESSSRRTTKRLRPKQSSAALLPLRTPPTHFKSQSQPQLQPQTQDHIIFNPPSTAPSPYHTPPIFLPPTDPRRTLLAPVHTHLNPHGTDPTLRLPPPVRREYEKVYHLGAQEIDEIRTLRKEDPWKWTRSVLAAKFGCTEFFVGMVAPATEERMEWSRRLVEQDRARWGRRRTEAREARGKRREMWGRDE